MAVEQKSMLFAESADASKGCGRVFNKLFQYESIEKARISCYSNRIKEFVSTRRNTSVNRPDHRGSPLIIRAGDSSIDIFLIAKVRRPQGLRIMGVIRSHDKLKLLNKNS